MIKHVLTLFLCVGFTLVYFLLLKRNPLKLSYFIIKFYLDYSFEGWKSKRRGMALVNVFLAESPYQVTSWKECIREGEVTVRQGG